MKYRPVSSYAHVVPWICLVAAGGIATARWLHPATYSASVYLVVSATAFIGFILLLVKR